jgi:hypothetical protein
MLNHENYKFQKKEQDFHLVTVSVDRIDFLNRLNAEWDLKLCSYVIYANGSTIIANVDVL